MEEARRTSGWMPQTTAVSPTRITALPAQWVREEVVQCGGRKVERERDEGRVGVVEEGGFRWARR